MTPCAPAEHSIRLVLMDHDGASYYIGECDRCMAMVPVPSGRCDLCSGPLDDHMLFLDALPVCPPRSKK